MTCVVFTHERQGTSWVHVARLGALAFAFTTDAPELTEDEAFLLVNLLGPVAVAG